MYKKVPQFIVPDLTGFEVFEKPMALLGPIYTVRFLSHATSSRQAYDMIYDCRSVLKHVLKCFDIFPDVLNNCKSCRGPVVSRCRMRQKSYRVNRPLVFTEIFRLIDLKNIAAILNSLVVKCSYRVLKFQNVIALLFH